MIIWVVKYCTCYFFLNGWNKRHIFVANHDCSATADLDYYLFIATKKQEIGQKNILKYSFDSFVCLFAGLDVAKGESRYFGSIGII